MLTLLMSVQTLVRVLVDLDANAACTAHVHPGRLVKHTKQGLKGLAAEYNTCHCCMHRLNVCMQGLRPACNMHPIHAAQHTSIAKSAC
jgi:CTP-dependent riboflavin kinase